MKKIKKYVFELAPFMEAVKTSTKIEDVLEKLGYKRSTYGYEYFHKFRSEHNVDISHFYARKNPQKEKRSPQLK